MYLGCQGCRQVRADRIPAFRPEPAGNYPSILKDHTEKIEARLGLFGLVTVTFVDDTGKEHTITRKYDPSNSDQIESLEYVRPEKVLPVMFLSQNEVVRIAEDDAEQLRFIDRFFDISYYVERIEEIESELAKWDVELAECISAYKKVKQLDETLARLKERQEALAKKLSNDVFANYRAAEEKNNEILRHHKYISDLIVRLQNEVKEWSQVALPDLSAQMRDKPEILRIRKALTELLTNVGDERARVVESATKASATIIKEYSEWKPTFQKIKEEYEACVRTAGGDEKALESERKRLVTEETRFRADRRAAANCSQVQPGAQGP